MFSLMDDTFDVFRLRYKILFREPILVFNIPMGTR